jgi:hypothetical protein
MDLYTKIKTNPPSLKVIDGAKELQIHYVSVMCDNKYTLRLKKNGEGEFKLSGGRFSLSNFQFKHEAYEIEWSADRGEWDSVIMMINSGTGVIENIASR